MDCLETAAFPGQSDEEIRRLLHMVVVGGGPTGVEFGAELWDFLHDDLAKWYPDLSSKVKITLIEALPHVLPMFSKTLVEYTEKTFAENKLEILTNTSVKRVTSDSIQVESKDLNLKYEIPYGLLVWAAGNAPRPIVKNLISKLNPQEQSQRRGIVVDDWLHVKGLELESEGIWALGDASASK